jgi:hypothetical protein
VEPIPAAAGTATKAEGEKSARGNLVKAVGQPAGLTGKDGKPVVNFTINSIAPVTCTEPYAQPAKNGQFIVLDVVAETTPDLANESFTHFDVSPSNFQFVGANGTTFNGMLSGQSYGCLPQAETFPMQGMGPAEKVAAKVVLDVPVGSGTLIFKPLFSTAGWEYTY